MTIVDFLTENAPMVMAWLNSLINQAPYAVFTGMCATVLVQLVKKWVRSRGGNMDGAAGWIQLVINTVLILAAWGLVRVVQNAGATEQEATDFVQRLFAVVTDAATLMLAVTSAGAISRGFYRLGKSWQVFSDWNGATGA